MYNIFMDLNFTYKLLNGKKVELFFILIVLASFLSIHIILKFLLMIVIFGIFHLKNLKWYLIVSLTVLFFVSNFSVFIVDKELKKDGTYQYYSIGGVVEGVDTSLGTIIFGKITRNIEGFRTNYSIEKEYFRMRLPFYSALISFRNDAIDKLYYGSNKQITLIPAMFYGEKRYISAKDTENFTLAGLNHILAISGQHVGIILLVIFSLLYKLPFKLKMVISSVMILLFIPIAGFKIPVIRAGVFVLIIAIAYTFDVKVRMNKLILWVASLFLIVEPDVLNSPSFALSFLAVYGISQVDRDYFLDHKFLSGIMVGIYATVFTTPYILANFGMINLLSFLNSILISPFAFLIILLGIFSLLSVKLVMPIGILAERLTYNLIDLLSKITEFGFILKYVPVWVGMLTIVILFILSTLHYRYILLFGFLILFYPGKVNKLVAFPDLSHSRGYFLLGDTSEVYFEGSSYEFRYRFLPEYVKNGGGRYVDFGYIDVGYDTRFLKIAHPNQFSKRVCLNQNGCEIVLVTSKKSLQKINLLDNTTYVTYSKKILAEKIITPPYYLYR
ncbi:MAG: ComEC/Rec2 family competence protein [Calditerrivibrio sp.]|uniref:ComEC/Rec2 family competence protein n=1 Tax=Calditerrivibrio sp. TaxID=2792612 RepID=UPI003D09E521